MKINNIAIITIALFIGIVGGNIVLPWNSDNKPAVISTENVVITSSLESVISEFKKMEKEDQDSVYKQITGAALYLKNTKALKETSSFDPILSRVQSDFGWSREKYPDFTNAVSKYLIEQGYDNPRLLDNEENRTWFYNIFNTLSEALKNE